MGRPGGKGEKGDSGEMVRTVVFDFYCLITS